MRAPALLNTPEIGRIALTNRALGEVLVRRGAQAVTCEEFLRDVHALAGRLPDGSYLLNLCTDRYEFLVAFAAGLVRGQVNLLTSDRSPHRLRQLASTYPDGCVIGGEAPGFTPVAVTLGDARGPAPAEVPLIPVDQPAAIVLTSGSTGEPVPHLKPFAALAACSEAAAARFGFDAQTPGSIVGTVPPQHMYGFETTVLLPLHAPISSYAGSTFFPQDVAQALAAVPAPRTLVTTPIQIRALLAVSTPLPPLAQVISATAPLPPELAQAAEAAWGTRVLEIFGATEVGSIASRRTLDGDAWQAYRSVELTTGGFERGLVRVAGLPEEVLLADRVELLGSSSFRLLGRQADVVKLAGKRASLAGLNAILCGIEGVEDGAFFVPEGIESAPTTRLLAFVVAPTRSAPELLAELRTRIEPPFLPRRIVKVSSLPRNDVGKIMRASLVELAAAG